MMKVILYTILFVALVSGVIALLPTPTTSTVAQPATALMADKSDSVNELGLTPITETREDNNFVLYNITWFDGQNWHENSQLTVVNGRIDNSYKQADNLPQIDASIDGQPGFVIPGLIDAHTHAWGSALQQALNFGVTTEIDMFSDLDFGKTAKISRAADTQTQQADFFSAGTLVTSPGGHGTQYGFPIPTIDTAEDAEQFVQDRVNEGSDFIKIVYNHKASYHNLTSINKTTLNAVIKAAQAQQKLAVVHISDHQSAVDAVAAGADGLVHTFGDEIISDALLTAMADKQVFIIPTLSVLASVAQSEHSTQLANDTALIQRMNSASLGMIKNGLRPFAGLPKRPKLLATAIENTRLMHQQGIRILAGSDAPNPGTAHGISLHGELELLNQAGLSPTETLQAAGFWVAENFPIGWRGRLIDGAKADLILLQADPRKDIKNTRKILHIWKNGFLLASPERSEQSEQDKSLTPKKLPANLNIDFTQNSLYSFFATEFQATSDQMMQGQSTAAVSWTEAACDDGGLLIQGEIKKGFPFPWAGVFLPFSVDMTAAHDLSKIQSVNFDVSGDVGTYQLMIFTQNSMQPVQLPFKVSEQCQPISIQPQGHQDVNWAAVTALAWVADGSRLQGGLASFALTLDNVQIQHE